MKFLEVTEDNWNSILRVNALGTLMQEAAKQMIRQGNPNFTPYSASKFAVIALIQAGSRELPRTALRSTASPRRRRHAAVGAAGQGSLQHGASSGEGEAMKDFAADILRGRVATPKDIAGTALSLASSDSDYMTGQIVMIDGGMTLV